MNKICFDIDGTLSELWYKNTWKRFSKRMLINSDKNEFARAYVKYRIRKIKPLMIPKIPIYVLTSRASWFRKETEKWFDKYNIKTIYVIMPDELILDQQKQIERKASKINRYEFTHYFEDEEDIREELTRLCPNCKILAPDEAIRMGFIN